MASCSSAVRDSNLAITGYVLSLFLPIVGLVIAVMLFAREEVGPAVAVLLMSLAGFAVGAAAVGLI